jgi:hypothetical protein
MNCRSHATPYSQLFFITTRQRNKGSRSGTKMAGQGYARIMSMEIPRMPSDDSRQGPRAKPAKLPPTHAAPVRRSSRYAQDPVSLGLRKLWQDVEKEPVPDEFLALLDAIDAAKTPTPDDTTS